MKFITSRHLDRFPADLITVADSVVVMKVTVSAVHVVNLWRSCASAVHRPRTGEPCRRTERRSTRAKPACPRSCGARCGQPDGPASVSPAALPRAGCCGCSPAASRVAGSVRPGPDSAWAWPGSSRAPARAPRWSASNETTNGTPPRPRCSPVCLLATELRLAPDLATVVARYPGRR